MAELPEPDHLRLAEERRWAILRGLSPQQRLAQATRMNRAMRELMAVGFRSRHPEWSETEIRRAVANRILHASTG